MMRMVKYQENDDGAGGEESSNYSDGEENVMPCHEENHRKIPQFSRNQ